MDVAHHGFDPYSAVISGTLTKLLLMELGGNAKAEAAYFINQSAIPYLSLSVNTTTVNSIEYARNATASQAIQANTQFEGLLKKWWLLSVIDIPGHPIGPDHVPNDKVSVTYGYAEGNVDDGLKFTFSGDEGISANWFPGLNRDTSKNGRYVFTGVLETKRKAIIDLRQSVVALHEHAQTIRDVIDRLSKY